MPFASTRSSPTILVVDTDLIVSHIIRMELWAASHSGVRVLDPFPLPSLNRPSLDDLLPDIQDIRPYIPVPRSSESDRHRAAMRRHLSGVRPADVRSPRPNSHSGPVSPDFSWMTHRYSCYRRANPRRQARSA